MNKEQIIIMLTGLLIVILTIIFSGTTNNSYYYGCLKDSDIKDKTFCERFLEDKKL